MTTGATQMPELLAGTIVRYSVIDINFYIIVNFICCIPAVWRLVHLLLTIHNLMGSQTSGE